MRRAALALMLLLAACAPAARPQPVAARLSAAGLAVELSDGRTCRAARPAEAAPAGPWRGALIGCPAGFRAEVVPDPATNPARLVVETVLTALALDGALSPRAAVTVSDAAGRAVRFASPP